MKGIPLISQRNCGLSVVSTSASGYNFVFYFSPWLLQLVWVFLHRIEISLAIFSSYMQFIMMSIAGIPGLLLAINFLWKRWEEVSKIESVSCNPTEQKNVKSSRRQLASKICHRILTDSLFNFQPPVLVFLYSQFLFVLCPYCMHYIFPPSIFFLLLS